MNGQGLDAPLVVQLCDEWGNPSPDQRIEIVMKALRPQLKVHLGKRGLWIQLVTKQRLLSKATYK